MLPGIENKEQPDKPEPKEYEKVTETILNGGGEEVRETSYYKRTVEERRGHDVVEVISPKEFEEKRMRGEAKEA